MKTIKDLPSPLKLDLACGQNKKEGFFGIDIVDAPGVDLVWDLEKTPWPFEDNSVDEIFCQHIIEHVKDLFSFVDEMYRVLKIDGKAEITAPYYNNIRAWQDPTHVRAISEATPFYFNKYWRELNKLTHYPIKSDFDFSSTYGIDESWEDRWNKMTDEEKRFAVRSYTNVVADIYITLTKRR